MENIMDKYVQEMNSENPCNNCGIKYASIVGIKEDEEPRQLCLGTKCVAKYLFVVAKYGIERACELDYNEASMDLWEIMNMEYRPKCPSGPVCGQNEMCEHCDIKRHE
jgi:hypothetical protein